MKIENQYPNTIERTKKENPQTRFTESFPSHMQASQENVRTASLSKLLSQIEEQGNLLSKQRTLGNLLHYKKLVKQWMEEAIRNGLALTEHQGRQRNRTYKLVKVIDQKLADLQKQVFEKEKEAVHILELVGEIKGLLINIYS